jgi:hypothetical protein
LRELPSKSFVIMSAWLAGVNARRRKNVIVPARAAVRGIVVLLEVF